MVLSPALISGDKKLHKIFHIPNTAQETHYLYPTHRPKQPTIYIKQKIIS